MHSVNRGLPHFPPGNQRTPEDDFDQLEVESTQPLERGQLLKIVKLPVEDISLRGGGSDVPLKCLTELFNGLEPADQAPRLYEFCTIPPAEELGRHLRLAAAAGFADVLRGKHGRPEPTQ